MQHAHPECGNGVTWSLELRRGNTRQRLAAGTAQGAKDVSVGPLENLAVQPGDLVSLLIGPRDGNHSCDLTAVDLTLTEVVRGEHQSARIEPRSGDANGTWPATSRPTCWPAIRTPTASATRTSGTSTPSRSPATAGPVIPAGSLLAKWQSAADAAEKQKLAEQMQKLLAEGVPDSDPSCERQGQPRRRCSIGS